MRKSGHESEGYSVRVSACVCERGGVLSVSVHGFGEPLESFHQRRDIT